ncbi:MAG: RNA 2',3'-cyclic phosphodiesterase [Bacteriovorax sp.]
MRLFIGIELPDDVKGKIFDYLFPLQITSKGWESPHDYHQTLMFLGETPFEKIEEIKLRMLQVNFRPFVLTTESFEFFNRRILYLSFIPSEKLLDLKKRIDQNFPEWIRPHEKEFLPHVTVKRWQRYEYNHLVEGIASREFPHIIFTVSALSLFKSEKDSENNKYHVIYRAGQMGLAPPRVVTF